MVNSEWRANVWSEIAHALTVHMVMLRDTAILDDAATAATLLLIDTVAAGTPVPSDDILRQVAAFEERYQSQAGPENAGAIGIARTQLDLAATVQRLMLRRHGLAAAEALLGVREALIALAEDHVFTLIPVWSDGVVIQPTNLAHYLTGTISPLRRANNRLNLSLQDLDYSPMGAAALAGPGFAVDRDELSDLLGHVRPVESTFDALAATDVFVAVAQASASSVSPLRMLFDELISWLRADPDALRMPDELVAPTDPGLLHLRVPAALQRIVRDAREVEETAAMVGGLVRGLPLAPAVSAVERAVEQTAYALMLAARVSTSVTTLVSGPIEINRAWLARNAGRGLATAGDLADFLMAEEAIDPVSARNIAALTIIRARLEGVEAPGITPQLIDSAALMVIGRELGIEIERLGSVFAPRRYIEKRSVLGGPAPVAIRELLHQERDQLRQDTDWLQTTNRRIALAEQNLAIRREEIMAAADI